MSRIRLTWTNASTTIVEQRVYRSTSPLDIDDMPAPLAVLPRRNREYSDTTIEDGLTYYYAVSSVLPDYSELISNEIKVVATSDESDPHWDNVEALLHFDGDLTDETGLAWSKPLVTYGTGVFDQAANLNSSTTAPNNVGSQSFTVEFFCKPISYGSLYPCVFSFGTTWGTGYIGVYIRRVDTGDFLSCYTYGKPTILTTCNILDGQFHHLALSYDGTLLRLFVDGILVGSADISGFFVSDTMLLRDIGRNSIECWIDEFRLTKGVARYTENFNPPTEPFPNN